jgi:competence protein ComFC
MGISPEIGMVMVSRSFPQFSRDQPGRSIQILVDAVLNLIYPESCILCDAPVASQKDRGVCTRCWRKTCALQIRSPYCPSCGLPFQSFADDSSHLCGRCALETPPFSGARSFGYYAAELSRLIQHLKFKGRKNLAGLIAWPLAWTFWDTWTWRDFDFVVPVPLHPRRQRERGFNQASLLARNLSGHIGVPVCDSMLGRVRYTTPQVGLTDLERLRNLHRAFKCVEPDRASGRRLLLIDDVLTTGATATSAVEALLESGAARVSVLTAARVMPGIG